MKWFKQRQRLQELREFRDDVGAILAREARVDENATATLTRILNERDETRRELEATRDELVRLVERTTEPDAVRLTRVEFDRINQTIKAARAEILHLLEELLIGNRHG